MMEHQLSPDDRMTRAINSQSIPHININGFLVALTAGDALIVLENNGLPVATLNMSFTSAKTMAVKLGQTIADLEAKTNRAMLTSDELEALLSFTKKEDQ